MTGRPGWVMLFVSLIENDKKVVMTNIVIIGVRYNSYRMLDN